MTHTTQQKLGLLVGILFVIACIASIANADPVPAIPANGVYIGNSVSIAIPKDITVTNINQNVSKVFGPNVEYTFQLFPAADSQYTITDADNNTIHVLPGVASAVSTNPVTVSFSSSEVNLTDGKGRIDAYANITFTPSAFGVPGVFRYKVEDKTTANTLWAAGIIRSATYEKEHYLDVYVGYKEGNDAEGHPYTKVPANLEIKGYAFFTEDTNITTQTGKLNSFPCNTISDVSLSDHPVSPVGDLYPTFNVEVTQRVEGNMADANHAFPVTVTVQNNGIGYFSTVGSIQTGSDLASNTTTATANLTHEQVLNLIGLNARATVASSETNNTLDTYRIKIENKTPVPIAGEKSVAADDSISHDSLALTTWPATLENEEPITTTTLEDANTRITYTNKLNSVSPTGIVRHVAPYAFMMMFAIFFVILLKRRKEEAWEER